ncbi:MAG: hypothetical protein J1F39_07700 [Clostridiales bacterium]|nr:hypothetical protein [Clostridiales bacterium]
MKYLNKYPFKDRTVGFWIGLGVAALAIISAILYIALCNSDKYFSTLVFVMMLVGGLTYATVMFTNFKIAALIPVVFYIIGFGFAIDFTLPPLSDVWNGVVFNSVGSNPIMLLTFSIIFLVCAIVGIATNFMNQKKEN